MVTKAAIASATQRSSTKLLRLIRRGKWLSFLKSKAPLIVTIFILIQPLIDVATTLGDSQNWLVSVGMVVRGLAMLAVFIYLSTQKTWRIPILAIGGFCLAAAIVQRLTGDLAIANLATLFKVFYLPLIVIFFYHFRNRLFSPKIYFGLLAAYLILLVLPALLQINLVEAVNYDGKIWQRGWFSAGNDVSAILLGLTAPALFDLIRHKQWPLLAVAGGLLIVAAVLIGTKVMIIGLLAVAVFLLIILSKNWSKRLKLGIGGGLAAVLVGGAAILPLTPVYQNTLIALNYHGVNSPADIFRPDIIDKVIFSERPTFLGQTTGTYLDADWSQKLFGLTQTETDVTVESDPFDLFFSVGILGAAVYIFTAVWFIKRLAPKRLKSEQKFSIGLLLVLSVVVGHVLLTPAVATILALNFIKLGKS
jgi:hypothetical protein